MPIQIVTIILRSLSDKYAESKEAQTLIYKSRYYLDKAFSNYKNITQLKNIIENIDEEFYSTTQIKDKKENIQAFIFIIVTEYYDNDI